MVIEITDRSAKSYNTFFHFEITCNLVKKLFFNAFCLFDNITAVQSCSSLFIFSFAMNK